MGSHRDEAEEVGRKVLAESIELQHLVAQDLAASPLPPLPRRRHPVSLDVLAVILLCVAIGLCGWLVV